MNSRHIMNMSWRSTGEHAKHWKLAQKLGQASVSVSQGAIFWEGTLL